MGVNLTNPSNGSTMSGPTLAVETKKIEAWLNGGVVAADMPAGQLNRTHLYRPDTDGFPSERSHEIQTGLVNRTIRDHWDPRQQSNRFDVLRGQIGADGAVAIGPGCSATVEHYGGSKKYVVRCWFGAKPMPGLIGTAAPYTPDEKLFGSVVLRHRDCTTGTITTYEASRRYVEPGWLYFTPGPMIFNARLRAMGHFTQARFTLSNTGTHDFWLEYQFDDTNIDAFRVVAFCQRGLMISAHKV